MVNSPLRRPSFLGGGPLGSYELSFMTHLLLFFADVDFRRRVSPLPGLCSTTWLWLSFGRVAQAPPRLHRDSHRGPNLSWGTFATPTTHTRKNTHVPPKKNLFRSSYGRMVVVYAVGPKTVRVVVPIFMQLLFYAVIIR